MMAGTGITMCVCVYIFLYNGSSDRINGRDTLGLGMLLLLLLSLTGGPKAHGGYMQNVSIRLKWRIFLYCSRDF